MNRGHTWAHYNRRKHKHIGGFQVCAYCGLVYSAKKRDKRRYRVCRWKEET